LSTWHIVHRLSLMSVEVHHCTLMYITVQYSALDYIYSLLYTYVHACTHTYAAV